MPEDSSNPRTIRASDSCSVSNTLTSFSLGLGRSLGSRAEFDAIIPPNIGWLIYSLILTPGKCEWADLPPAVWWPWWEGMCGNSHVTEVLHPEGVAFSGRCRGQ